MSPQAHLLISSAAAGLLVLVSRSWLAAAACLVSGTLVDLDHYLDFWLNRGFRWRPSELLHFCQYGASRRFLVLLHAWELVPLLLLATWQTGPPLQQLWLGTLAGYTLHMAADQLGNRQLHPGCYFLLYRICRRFEHRRLAPGWGTGIKSGNQSRIFPGEPRA